MPQSDLDQLFATFPPGRNLAEQVRVFYGSTFQIEWTDAPEGSSTFGIDADADTLQVRRAIIRLNRASDRQVEAATHELLHLRQPIRGFPLIRRPSLPSSEPGQNAFLDSVLTNTINIVDHDIFVGDFVGMGLPLSRFLARRRDIPRYEEEARSYRGKTLVQEFAWMAWSWWAFEYLNNYMSIEHGDEQAETLAVATERAGKKALPRFEETAEQIRRWRSTGGHRHHGSYFDAMRKLFILLHLPPVDDFFRLSAGQGSVPTAVRVSFTPSVSKTMP